MGPLFVGCIHRRALGRASDLYDALAPPSDTLAHETGSSKVGLGGIEPPTSALSVLRSNRLSYSPG